MTQKVEAAGLSWGHTEKERFLLRGRSSESRREANLATRPKVWLATAAAALAFVVVVSASPLTFAGPSTSARYATVELSGVVILRVRDSAGWPSVYARADEIYKRLNEAINTYQDRLSPNLVRIGQTARGPALYIGDHLFVTVDQGSARRNGTSQEKLAEFWAANLKAAISRYVAINSPGKPPVF